MIALSGIDGPFHAVIPGRALARTRNPGGPASRLLASACGGPGMTATLARTEFTSDDMIERTGTSFDESIAVAPPRRIAGPGRGRRSPDAEGGGGPRGDQGEGVVLQLS